MFRHVITSISGKLHPVASIPDPSRPGKTMGCTSCHDPHKADKGIGQEHTDWAASGHGDVNGVAWSTEDFKANASCIRCHTSTGFINYVQSGYTLPTQTWATNGDTTRQVLTCRACHTSFNFKNSIRSAGQYTAPYNNGNSPATFPSATTSNRSLAVATKSLRVAV